MLTFKNYIEEPERFIALLMQYEKLPDQNPEEVMHSKYLEAVQAKRDFKRYIFKKNKLNFLKALHFALHFSGFLLFLSVP